MGGQGSGRRRIDYEKLDSEIIHDILDRDLPRVQVAEELGISTPTLAKRIAKIQQEQGILMHYRSLQSLHLTALQAKILEAITPEKINEAPLRDLILAFKVLKDKELTLEGKPSDIKGLVGYLLQIEKEEAALTQEVITDGQIVDIQQTIDEISEPGEWLPEL